MAALYLSASGFSTSTWKLESIEHAKKLTQDTNDAYLRLSIAQQESSLMRMTGKTQEVAVRRHAHRFHL